MFSLRIRSNEKWFHVLGIETAMQDLQKENEEKLWQEGILRHVPVFGNIVNWWSPLDKENGGIKGRSLDLSAGVIESTENIYRYHKQQKSAKRPSTETSPEPSVVAASETNETNETNDTNDMENHGGQTAESNDEKPPTEVWIGPSSRLFFFSFLCNNDYLPNFSFNVDLSYYRFSLAFHELLLVSFCLYWGSCYGFSVSFCMKNICYVMFTYGLIF